MGNKSKILAGVLCFFLGTIGVHRYYLGYNKQGAIQTCGMISFVIGYNVYFPALMAYYNGVVFLAALMMIFGAVTSIWAFVDFIRILTGQLIPADGSEYVRREPVQVKFIQPAAPARDTMSANDNVEMLAKLAKLHEQGILTDEEFQNKKDKLLENI